MEVSKLTFSKETKERMNTSVSYNRKRQLRWDKLKELESTGRLSLAKNRREVAGMMGLGNGFGAGYSWISSEIKKGLIKETLTGFDKNNMAEYEYHLSNPPVKPISQLTAIEPKADREVNINQAKDKDKIKATIRYGELVIELDGVDSNIIESIIERLANK